MAVQDGIPLRINMADGKEYTVTDRLNIAVGPTQVVVIDEQGLAHVLPMLTMTGISYLRQSRS
jgi:hypothetical protein